MNKYAKILFFCLLFPLIVFSQKEAPATRKQIKRLEKTEALKRKKGEEKRKEALEKHMKIQTKEVQKRMKKNKKKSKRINENRKEFFLIRWFN